MLAPEDHSAAPLLTSQNEISSSLNNVVTQMSSDAASNSASNGTRKRRANLSRINLGAATTSTAESSNGSVDVTVVAPIDEEKQSSSATTNKVDKRIRLNSASSTLSTNSLFTASRGSSRDSSSSPSPSPSICSSDEFSDLDCGQNTPSVKASPLARCGTIIGNGEFELVGDGDECKAVHIPNQAIFHCQALESKSYNHFLKVAERIESSNDKLSFSEMKELKRLLMPEGTRVVQGEEKNLYYVISPDHQGSLITDWRTEKNSAMARRSGSPWSEQQSREIFRQIVQLVHYCHKIGIYLRDFRLQTIVYSDRARNLVRLLHVRNVHVASNPEDDTIGHHVVCCPVYTAPEVLQIGKTYRAKPADIWGLGILHFMLLTGRFPFFGANPPELARRIRQCKFGFSSADRVSRPARMLAHCLIRLNPNERPLAEEILVADWLQETAEPAEADLSYFMFRSGSDLEDGDRIAPPTLRTLQPRPSASDRSPVNVSGADIRLSLDSFVRVRGREMGPFVQRANGDDHIVPGDCSVPESGRVRIAVRFTVAQL